MPRLPRVQPGRAKTIERSSAGRRLRPIAVAALVLVDILGLLAMYRLHWMHGLARSDVVDVKIRKRNPALPLPRGLEPGALQSVPTPSLPGSARLTVEEARLQRLREDPRYPLVYFDVSIKGQAQGRIEMVLFTDVSPRAAENFRLLCTGEKGVVPQGREGAGNALSFTGSYFYRIIDQFIDQAGANTESAFGGWFMDDPGGLALVHDRKGLLSMANIGPDSNTSHFSIMQAPAPHLNGHYTIFGEVVSGWDVAHQVNLLSKGKPENTATKDDGAQITQAGMIREGGVAPDLWLGVPEGRHFSTNPRPEYAARPGAS